MRLEQPEALVADWILSGQGAAVGREMLQDLMEWREFRERLWRSYLAAKLTSGTEPVELEISDYECEALLALVPSTFRWGTGNDVGFSLKWKLADNLYGPRVRDDLETLRAVKAMFEEKDADSPSKADDQAGHQDEAAAESGC